MEKTTKFIKFIAVFLILVCSFLCFFVSPEFEDISSVLSINAMYNVIPYVTSDEEELAYLNDLSDIQSIDTFTGTVTAYGPDCNGCIGTTASGYKVANRTSTGFETITTTYLDEYFGELRILAADNSKFSFGTVIRITGERINGSITGIVLDTGGAMINAWNEGNILIDLMFSTEKSQAVYDFGRQKNVKFEVLRYGF
jgi:3D (Asp-Asp-Asp) domain-containing protein